MNPRAFPPGALDTPVAFVPEYRRGDNPRSDDAQALRLGIAELPKSWGYNAR
jgi:hypothetical protein